MKKIKILALTLMLSFMLIGSGYASWNDKLVVANTVETGEMKLNFIKDADYPKTKGSEFTIPKVIINDSNKKIAEVKLTNLYPDSFAAFKLKAANLGTIPARISDLSVKFSGDTLLLPYLSYEAGFFIDKDGDGVSDGGTSYFKGKLSDIGKDFSREFKKVKNISLQPNGKGTMCFNIGESKARDLDNDGCKENYIIIYFDKDAPRSTENKTLNFDLTLNFKQNNK